MDSLDYPQAFKLGYGIGEASWGAAQTIVGGGGEVLGLGLDATGVGAPAGLALNVASGAAMLEGAADVAAGFNIAYSAATEGSSNGVFNSNADVSSESFGSKNSNLTVEDGQYTEIRFGENGEVYAKLEAPSNSSVQRWQRMNGNGGTNRENFMGSTPGKESGVGLQVQDRMRNEGTLKGNGTNRIVLGEDGKWYPIDECDMGHIEAAVDYWNREGRFYGARSPEVRRFMSEPENYVLEPSSINRRNGASSGSMYKPEATEAEKGMFFSNQEIK